MRGRCVGCVVIVLLCVRHLRCRRERECGVGVLDVWSCAVVCETPAMQERECGVGVLGVWSLCCCV